MITLKKPALVFILTFVATAATAQHQIVFETGDTVKCEISTASSAYMHFLNDEGAGRKASFSFVSAVYFAEKWWEPAAFRDAHASKIEYEDHSMMRAERMQNASPSELIAKSGRLIVAGTIIPVISTTVGYLIDGNPGAIVAIAGAVVGFVCLIAGGLKLRNAGVALERYENDWAKRPNL